jgi:hypothetical protein
LEVSVRTMEDLMEADTPVVEDTTDLSLHLATALQNRSIRSSPFSILAMLVA